jgi:hypothetical protein
LVDFGSLRPSGAIGAGFRAIGGHLQVILLQGSFQGHQGHFSVGAVGGYVHPFLVIQKPRLAIFDLLNLMAEVSEPFEVIFTTNFSIQD